MLYGIVEVTAHVVAIGEAGTVLEYRHRMLVNRSLSDYEAQKREADRLQKDRDRDAAPVRVYVCELVADRNPVPLYAGRQRRRPTAGAAQGPRQPAHRGRVGLPGQRPLPTLPPTTPAAPWGGPVAHGAAYTLAGAVTGRWPSGAKVHGVSA
jgi:hypothetical protein